MKTLQQILESSRTKKDTKKAGEELIKGIDGSMRTTTVNSTSAMVNALDQIKDHWDQMSSDQQKKLQDSLGGLIDKIPRPELGITFNGLENIKVKTLTVEGLEEVLTSVINHIKTLDNKISSMQFDLPTPHVTIPEIKLPTITVPEPKVTVHIPVQKMPKMPKMPDVNVSPTVTIDRQQLPNKVIVTKNKYGGIQKIIEEYSDGNVETTKVDNSWLIDDQRPRTR